MSGNASWQNLKPETSAFALWHQYEITVGTVKVFLKPFAGYSTVRPIRHSYAINYAEHGAHYHSKLSARRTKV